MFLLLWRWSNIKNIVSNIFLLNESKLRLILIPTGLPILRCHGITSNKRKAWSFDSITFMIIMIMMVTMVQLTIIYNEDTLYIATILFMECILAYTVSQDHGITKMYIPFLSGTEDSSLVTSVCWLREVSALPWESNNNDHVCDTFIIMLSNPVCQGSWHMSY